MRQATMNDLRFWVRDVRRRCGERSITVQFDKDAQTAHATERGIVIPAPSLPMSYEAFCKLRYYALHEVGHLLRKECFALLKDNPMTPNYFGVWNCIEDELQEDETRRAFRGDRKTLCVGRDIHITDMCRQACEDKVRLGVDEPDEDTQKRVAVHALAHRMRISWHPGVEHLIALMFDAFGKGARAWYDTLVSEGWDKRLVPMSVEDGMRLSRELAERLWPEEAQQNEDMRSKKASGESEENQEDSDGEPCEAQQNGDDEEEGEGPSSQEPKQGDWTVDWKDLLNDDHKDKIEGAPAGGMNIDYTGWSAGEMGTYYPDSDIYQTNEFDSLEETYEGSNLEFHPDTSFANQLRRYIQSTAKVGWENNRLTGKRINKRALKRIVTGTREYNRRVFQRKHDKQALNTCITLLVDWSGSMYGTRAEIAANAAAILTDCFENVLGVPVEVLGHTERRGGLWMYNIKKYGERLSGQDVFNRFKKCEMSGNADADALLYTYDRIRNRPEKRKIVLSISDGCPADCYDYNTDPGTMLVHTVNMIRGEGVEVHGIGAEHPQVKEFYGSDSEVVMDLASLAPTLLNAAKKFVLSS
jgi:hypothetical protein